MCYILCAVYPCMCLAGLNLLLFLAIQELHSLLYFVFGCRDHDDCVSVLAGLRLWHSQQLQGGLQGYILNPVFKDNLRIALLGG